MHQDQVDQLVRWVDEQGRAGMLVTLGKVDDATADAFRPLRPAPERSAMVLLADRGPCLVAHPAIPSFTYVPADEPQAVAADCPGSGAAGWVAAIPVAGGREEMVQCGVCGQHFAVDRRRDDRRGADAPGRRGGALKAAARAAAVALVLLLVGGCSAVRFVFGKPYDWNNPDGRKPTREQKKACNAACDEGGDRSDRDDAMCHFACVSLGDPWYSEGRAAAPGGSGR